MRKDREFVKQGKNDCQCNTEMCLIFIEKISIKSIKDNEFEHKSFRRFYGPIFLFLVKIQNCPSLIVKTGFFFRDIHNSWFIYCIWVQYLKYRVFSGMDPYSSKKPHLFSRPWRVQCAVRFMYQWYMSKQERIIHLCV